MSNSERPQKTYVMKFGGSSLAGPKEILQSIDIVKKYAQDYNLIVVCSAMGDTTDFLLKAIDFAKKGDLEKARKVTSEIRANHHSAARQTISTASMQDDCMSRFSERFDELDKVLLGISLLRDLSPRSLDYILSFGERLATTLVHQSLESAGLRAKYLTGGEAGILTDESFGSAEPVQKITNEKLKESLLPLIKEGTDSRS